MCRGAANHFLGEAPYRRLGLVQLRSPASRPRPCRRWYTALVDPRCTFHYQGIDRNGNSFTGTGEVAARIPGANEQNNTLALTRAAIADCVRVMRQGVRPFRRTGAEPGRRAG
jgi:hypothetical protein